MSSSARKLTVRMEEVRGRFRLVFRIPPGTELRGRRFSQARLDAVRAEFDDLLDTVYRHSSRRDHGLEQDGALAAAIWAARRFTAMALREFLKDSRYTRLMALLSRMMVDGIHDLIIRERPLGIIEYEGSLENCIPLDYLFINLRKGASSLEGLSRGHLIASLAQVLGFAFIIRRNAAERGPVKPQMIEVDAGLKVRFFGNRTLPGMDRELSFFEPENSRHFRTTVVYPGDDAKDAAATLLRRISEGRDARFHHYCCHCETQHASSWRHRLVFGNGVDLSMTDLQLAFDEAPHGIRRSLSSTLCFLNACGAGVVSPSTQFSFPSLFVGKLGHMGFIGPEYVVPDAFASEFARVFYAYFLTLGHLGLALFRARWYFAKKYNNPLGLFYALYADPDIRLTKTAESVNF